MEIMGKIMYKTVLLTQNEIKLLLDVIENRTNYRSANEENNTQNLHIIKRHLMGLIPTENSRKD